MGSKRPFAHGCTIRMYNSKVCFCVTHATPRLEFKVANRVGLMAWEVFNYKCYSCDSDLLSLMGNLFVSVDGKINFRIAQRTEAKREEPGT